MLKSELVTSVVPNRSVICLGPTIICLAIDGSTLAKSNFSFAVLNFAIVKPSVPDSAIFEAEGKGWKSKTQGESYFQPSPELC